MKIFELYSIIISIVILFGTCGWTAINCYVTVTNMLATHSTQLAELNNSVNKVDKTVNNLQTQFTQFLLQNTKTRFGSN